MTITAAMIEVLSDYAPHTLYELTERVCELRGEPCMQTAVSARWRDKITPKFRTAEGPKEPGSKTWLYRILPPQGQGVLFETEARV